MLDGRMYYVDGAVRSAGNDLQNVVADDWRCLKLERSSLPDTVALCCGDIGGLLHQAGTVVVAVIKTCRWKLSVLFHGVPLNYKLL